MGDSIIKINGAGVRFKDFTLEGLNIEIPRGMITALEGPNGAGKSTLIKMILGVYSKMSGSINVGGYDTVKQRKEMLEITSLVSEDREFFKEFSPLQNGELYKGYYQKWDEERFKELLKRMAVPVHTKVGDLSKGNYIRFQTAFAMATHPQILILDEPTAGLDPVFRVDYIKILQELVAEEEVTVLISTHMTGDINKIADYILEIRDGKCTICENV